jgi:hypothetical protein
LGHERRQRSAFHSSSRHESFSSKACDDAKPYLSLVYWDSEIELDAELEAELEAELPEEFQLAETEFVLLHTPVPTERLNVMAATSYLL